MCDRPGVRRQKWADYTRPEGESGALRGSPCWPEVFYFGCLISCWNGIITGSQRGRAGFGRHTFLSAILGNVEGFVCLFIYFFIFEDLDTSNFYYTSTFFKFVLLLSIILLYQCLYRYSLHCQKRHLFLFFSGWNTMLRELVYRTVLSPTYKA